MKETTIWTADRIAQMKATYGVEDIYLCQHNGADAAGYYRDGIFYLAKGSKLSPDFIRQTEDDWGREDYSTELLFRNEMTDDGYFKDNIATRDEGYWSELEMARIVCGEKLPEGDYWTKV